MKEEEHKVFTTEDIKNVIDKFSKKAHKVDLVIHTPHGQVAMKTQMMTDTQLDEFRGSFKQKITNPHGYLEITVTDGMVIVPHELLVTSVIQIGIDVEYDENKELSPEENTIIEGEAISKE